MFSKFKNRNVRFILSAALSFVLVFSAMLNLVASADAPMPDIMATETVSEAPAANVSPLREKPEADDSGLDERMKDALTAVKEVFEINEKTYTVFNYNYYPGDDYYYLESWHFNWTSSNGMTNISANVTGDGKIRYYNKYEYSEKTASKNVMLAKISKAHAKSRADKFLKKILGDEFSGYKLSYQNLSYPSERYNLGYVLTKNGYEYPNFYVYVDVDKINGEILSFSRYSHPVYDTDDKYFDYQDASKVINKDEAVKSYLNNIGVELVYTSYYDWQTKELTIKPVYRLGNDYNQYISAVTGEVVEVSNDYGITPLMMNDSGENVSAEHAYAAGDSGGVSFSEAELAELENLKDYITADRAIEIIAESFDLKLGGPDSQNYTYLYADYMNPKKYLWHITLYGYNDGYTTDEYMYYPNEYTDATVDAKTGTVISYSNYSYPTYYYDGKYYYYHDNYYDYDGRKFNVPAPKPLYTYDEATKIVYDKIGKLSPYDIEKNFVLVDSVYPTAKTEKESYYYFYFARVVNGIKFESNGISVSFDNTTGKITYYNLAWYENAKFPKLGKIISEEKALDIIADFSGYNIYYMSNGLTDEGKINAVLLYRFNNPTWVDPFTGKCIGWNFEEVQKYEPSTPSYKDLGGHWSESIVKTLTDNGIYVWGGDKFEPDKAITKGEFVDYLKFFINNSYYFTELGSSIFTGSYPYQYYRDIDKLGKDSDKVLTKQEAAKIICEIAGYGELGKHSNIFAYPFAGGKCDEEYKGYVAIMKAFGLISGDSKNSYNGTDDLTRAEAASMIYQIIMSFNINK